MFHARGKDFQSIFFGWLKTNLESFNDDWKDSLERTILGKHYRITFLQNKPFPGIPRNCFFENFIYINSDALYAAMKMSYAAPAS